MDASQPVPAPFIGTFNKETLTNLPFSGFVVLVLVLAERDRSRFLVVDHV